MGIAKKDQSGFTLPELVAVVVIIAILAAISFFVLKPDNVDAERRNSQRQTNLALIAQALANYQAKNGALPEGVTVDEKAIGTDSEQVDLCKSLVPAYMTDLPMDPAFGQVAVVGSCNAEGQEYTSGYTVKRSADSTAITLSAPNAEDDATISLTKHFR